MAVSAFKSTTRRPCSAVAAPANHSHPNPPSNPNLPRPNHSEAAALVVLSPSPSSSSSSNTGSNNMAPSVTSSKPTGNTSIQRSRPHLHRRSSSFTDATYRQQQQQQPSSPRVSIHKPAVAAAMAGRSARFLDRQFSEIDIMMGKGKPCTREEEDMDQKSIDSPRTSSSQCMNDGYQTPPLHFPSSKKQTHDQESTPSYLGSPKRSSIKRHDMRACSTNHDDPEAQVEEKIIRAVHAQNKPKCGDDSVIREYVDEIYDTIKAEVWHVVTNIQKSIENPQEKSLLFECPMNKHPLEKTSHNSQLVDELMKAFKQVCKTYAIKVEQVEKEVQKLRSQLDAEEQRCLKLTNFINELLLLDYENIQVKKCYEDNMVPTQLLDSQSSMLHKSNQVTTNKDGLLLPWLQWEETSLQGWSSGEHIQPSQKCASKALSFFGKLKCSQQCEQSFVHGSMGSKKLMDVRFEKDPFTKRRNSSSRHLSDCFLNIKDIQLISERIHFRTRIESRELLLCVGTLHIF